MANNISIAGKTEDQVRGRESIEVKATGHISGDIVTKHLSMIKGAIFNGMSNMADAGQSQSEESDRKVVEFAAKER